MTEIDQSEEMLRDVAVLPEVRRRAQLVVAGRALSPDDCHELLAMLGLRGDA